MQNFMSHSNKRPNALCTSYFLQFIALCKTLLIFLLGVVKCMNNEKQICLDAYYLRALHPSQHYYNCYFSLLSAHLWLFQISMKLPSAKIELGPNSQRFRYKFSFCWPQNELADPYGPQKWPYQLLMRPCFQYRP